MTNDDVIDLYSRVGVGAKVVVLPDRGQRMPVANAILTTENLEQALARQTDKGRDAARVAVEMARLIGSANRP